MAKLYAEGNESTVTNTKADRKASSIPYQPVKTGKMIIKPKKAGSEPKGQVLKLKLKTA